MGFGNDERRAGVLAKNFSLGTLDARPCRFSPTQIQSPPGCCKSRTLSAKCFPCGRASLRVLTSFHRLFLLAEKFVKPVLETSSSSLRYLGPGA
jgi:hypothetical protein